MDKLTLILERLKGYQPEKVIVFGSYARGEGDKYSDIDLVVIKKTNKRFLERLIEVSEIIGSDIDKVDVFVYTPKDWRKMIEWGNAFAERVLKEGRIVYEKK